jgi:hypothetical protein
VRQFVEIMKILYNSDKVAEKKIIELFNNDKITEEEKRYILNAH